jgi:hypothetical protein
MKRRMLNWHFATLLAVVVSLSATSCKDKKKEDPKPENKTVSTQTVREVNANTAPGAYTLFSFKDNTVIANSDSNSTKWDIGFKSTTIIVNGGTSGPGNAAALIYTGLFSDLTEAPENGYKQDNDNITPPHAIPTGSGNGWYNYSGVPTHVITPIPGRVLVFRTADDKYAKVELISYYKGVPATPNMADEAGYYTFRFTYQSDGSRTF